MFDSQRVVNLVAFLACVALLAYALYAQHVLGLEPCALCIFQRIGVIVMGVLFLVAALHRPRGRGACVYAIMMGAAALFTAGVSARHIYIEHQPPGSVPPCEAPLGVLLEFRPLVTVIREVLIGGGDCQAVRWRFIGLSMPEWVLIWVILLGIAGVTIHLRVRKPGANT